MKKLLGECKKGARVRKYFSRMLDTSEGPFEIRDRTFVATSKCEILIFLRPIVGHLACGINQVLACRINRTVERGLKILTKSGLHDFRLHGSRRK